MIELDGIWALTDGEGDHACKLTLPGDGVSALVAAGHLPDPYWGRNEYECRWPTERAWVARRTFHADRTNLELIVEGLDTVADVVINGVTVLNGQSAYRIYRCNASDALRQGENTIEIRFAPMADAAAERAALSNYPIPWSKNCPIPNGNHLRKMACDFGWDWNLALAPFGVTGGLKLVPQESGRVRTVAITQTLEAGVAVVTLDMRVPEWEGEITASLCGQSTSVRPANGKASAVLRIPDPELWWPVGLGAQPLHRLELSAGDETVTRQIGLCQIEHVTEPDATGAGFLFRINGHDTFMRGANWIPADALAGRISREKTRDLLQSAIDANMNMIRIWGGGRYEADWFYDLCDEMGLLVWQDFMFSCNLYPADDAFLAEVAAEVSDQVWRLNHHPCIALWCGDNELVGALTWYKVSVENRDRYLVAYDRLNRTIETNLKAVLPEANWWPSSPCPGHMDFGDSWHDDRSGDMHFWSVWHEGRDFEHYRDVKPRFCSEFGFQSFPSMPAIRRFADPDDINISTPVMESHQKNVGGNARIAETMFRYFRFPEGFENFVYLSQIQQGLAIKTAVDYWRSLKPHCMGALYWQLNDTWPVASWASLDHGGDWKLLHYMARRFFAPVNVVAIPEGDITRLIAINDTRESVKIDAQPALLTLDGATKPLGSVGGTVSPDRATPLGEIAATAIPEDALLIWDWSSSDGQTGRDHLAIRPYKSLPLPPPGLRIETRPTEAGRAVTLSATATSLYAVIESDVPGRFSENAVLVTPEHPVEILFRPDDPAAQPTFQTRDLYGSAYPET